MLIVDAQVHIWSAGPPTNAAHRQVTSYTAEECIRDMDAAGVDACLLHPPGWDPNSGKISEEAAGHARIALRLHPAAPGELDDRRHDGLAVACRRESRDPDRIDGVELSA